MKTTTPATIQMKHSPLNSYAAKEAPKKLLEFFTVMVSNARPNMQSIITETVVNIENKVRGSLYLPIKVNMKRRTAKT